ncbi:MAG TPA: hypothetical protein DDX98_02565 [Bacteroidales bacterium]|nr:hypothetical protein [Bacteroidales bacterium]
MEISKKVAKEQLEKLLDYYDYEYKDLDDMSKKYADKILKSIMKGRVEVSDTGEIKHFLKYPLGNNKDIKELTYGHMKGIHKQEMDEYGADSHNAKGQALMGALCGRGLSIIEELEGPDLSVVENLGILLLGL